MRREEREIGWREREDESERVGERGERRERERKMKRKRAKVNGKMTLSN